MRGIFIFVRLITVALMVLPCCSAVFAQDKIDLGRNQDASRSRLTSEGAGGNSTTVEKPGGADGQEKLPLGGPRRPLYRLRPSDVVEIDFVVAPEFNQTLTIQPDGYVILKDAGMVDVQGLNMEEFSQAVEKAYRGYLHDPQVAAALKDFQRPYFIVGGEVGKPGKYELRSETTVAEAVQIAGGLTPESKHSQVVLFRRITDDLVETRLLDLKKMLRQRRLKEDLHLRAGDMVFVPQNSISKIARFLTKPAVGMYMNSTQF